MFHELAARLKGTMLHPQWLAARFRFLSRRYLRDIKGSLIVDIGSGDSRHEDFVDSTNRIYRLDYPDTNRLYHRPPDVYGDACSLPIATDTADVVFLFEVLEHVVAEKEALFEVQRILKPGGRFYVSVPFIYPIHDAPIDYRRFTIYGLRVLLAEAGFVVHKEIQHGNSFVTALQMFNLAMLETVRDIGKRSKPFSAILAILVYPLCIMVNVIGLPLLWLPWRSASCFGYFIIAGRR